MARHRVSSQMELNAIKRELAEAIVARNQAEVDGDEGVYQHYSEEVKRLKAEYEQALDDIHDMTEHDEPEYEEEDYDDTRY